MIVSDDKQVFSGSYAAADITFLLRPLAMAPTPVAEKERLIQSGQRHYAEMIGEEPAIGEAHREIFAAALQDGQARMGREVAALAATLAAFLPNRPIVLASLVRAGVPLGVLLRRALVDLGCETYHYGISIVRDRGIDRAALDAMIAWHGAEGIVFVDGWTGKGAIATELAKSLAGDDRFPRQPRLVTLADPCGRAWLAASGDDWLIPSGILGATVSGLVSRSILTNDGGYHGCVHCDHLAHQDETRRFVDQVDQARRAQPAPPALHWPDAQRQTLRADAERVVDTVAQRFGITNRNRIKPGIAEATRALLRRVPDHVLVRDRDDPDVRLLVHLADRTGVPVEALGDQLGPYRAITIIRKVT
ncbi:MAG: cysteine protease StiP family protein [Candidatus Sericytochromatia bacterium]|nr:cysteine protease StiP family protein [Candidatus Sericytochromatia bacterium]